MTLKDVPPGATIFVDSNIFLLFFHAHPQLGDPCRDFLERIERKEIVGVTSAQVLGDVAHRLMTVEASVIQKWPMRGIGRKLKRHPALVTKLSRYRQAIDEISLFGVGTLDVTRS